MSAPDAALAAVCALDAKAVALVRKQHYARSAEKSRAAAEAAAALRVPDCLVTAMLQVDEAEATLCHEQCADAAPGTPREEGRGSPFHRVLQLTLTAAETVQRRRAARTLLPGACTPVEEAWHAARRRLRLNVADDDRTYDATWVAPFVGYEAYLHAAMMAINVALVLRTNADATAALLLATFAASAAELMAQPRREPEKELHGEYTYVRMLRRPLDDVATYRLDARVGALLSNAWALLQSSGVLRERDLYRRVGEAELRAAAFNAAAEAARAGEVLRRCELAGCGAREVHAAQFKKCAACKGVVYCSREHQVADWSGHKKACKAARKAADGA